MFDPFQDFQTAGYLRNLEGLKNLDEIKRFEHFFFESNLEEALEFLKSRRGDLTYEHFLKVHKILFSDFYPWAGKDREDLGVGRIVGKGESTGFELSELSRRAVEWGLHLGNDKEYIAKRPGAVMGAFAWGHPFLDGNGRTMLLVHSELCHRANFSIDWMSSQKTEYLSALSYELKKPEDQILDKYLLNLIEGSKPRSDWVIHFKSLPGLGGMDDGDENIAYQDDDQEAIAQYEEIKRSRKEIIPGASKSSKTRRP